MRIVIDLQPCQNGSRGRGIGRYASGMTRALIANAGAHEIWLALNARFAETIQAVRDDFEGLIPQDRIVVFATPARTAIADATNAWRRRAAEIVRSYAIEALKPDVVFIPSPLEGLWDDTVTSVEPGPWITAVTLHDLIPLVYPQEHLQTERDRVGYLRQLQQIVSSDLVLAISAFIEAEAIQRLDIPSARIVHTLEGTEALFRPIPLTSEARATLLGKFRISRPFILNTSPFEFRKNIDGLLAGFACVPARLRQAHQLVIVGKMDAYARDYIARRAQLEGLAHDDVVLPGYVSDADLIGLYAACEMFVFPSLSEGFGLPVLEAMACGAPVLGSNTTSIPEVIGRADATFDPREPGEIGAAIGRLLGDASLRATLRAWGLERAGHFTWAAAAERAIAAFERAHDKRSPPMEPGAEPANPAAKVRPTRRPALAFVVNYDLAHSRSGGYARALLPHLSAYYDITVITAGGQPAEPWITANHRVRDARWFDVSSGQFDRVLYNVDTQLNDVALNLVETHPGILLLHPCPRRRDAPLRTGRAMPHDVQRDLYAVGGFAAIVTALDDAETGDAKADGDITAVSGAHLRAVSVGSIVDTPHLLPTRPPDADRCRMIPAMAVRPEPMRDLAFRQFMGIPAEAPVVVAYAGSLAAASIIAAGFRSSAAARSSAHLILSVESDDETASTEDILSRLPGRIHRIVNDLGGRYMEMLAVGDLAILAVPLPPGVERQLRRDCHAKAIPVMLASSAPAASADRLGPCSAIGKTALSAETLIAFLDAALGKTVTHTALHRTPPVTTDTPKPDTAEVAQAIHEAIEHLNARSPHARYRSVLASFPQSVRDMVPNGNDLADVARAMARNAALARPPRLFLDLSSIARTSGGRVRRLTRAFVHALLKGTAAAGVEPIAHDGSQYMTARTLAAELIGLHSPGLPDEPLQLRAGDRLLDLGGTEPFATIPREALRALRAAGVLCIHPTLGRLMFERPDLLAQIAAAFIEAAQTVPPHGRSAAYQVSPSVGKTPDEGNQPQRSGTDDVSIIRLVFDGSVAAFPATAVHDSPPQPVSLDGPAVARLNDALRTPPSGAAAGAVDWSRLHFVVTGHVLGSYSLAIINRALARTLEHSFPEHVRLLPVETNPITDLTHMPADERALMRQLADRPPPATGRHVVISHHYPVLVPAGNYDLRLALFFWEESEVPLPTIELLAASFDAVIAPTGFVARALVNSGLRIPAAPISQPVDAEAFVQLGEAPRPTAHKPLTFFHISSCFPRKGADVLLAAWARAFHGGDGVRLVIKTFPNPHNTVEADIAALRQAQPDIAPIELINADLDKPEILRLYQQADVMVLPTRGEGYNLPALEAMLARIPLIVTGHGAHRDFCGPDEARLIDFRFAPSGSHVSQAQTHALWVEPDVDDLVLALREMVDPTKAAAIASRREAARATALAATDTQAWLQRLRDFTADLLRPPPEPARIAWISTWQVACGIATYSAYLLNAASPELRRRITVLCDRRTAAPAADGPTVDPIACDPVWVVEMHAKHDAIITAAQRHAADVLVIQHQDGLISWEELANILNHAAVRTRITVVVLHNPRGMHVVGAEARAPWLAALRHASRILVHSVSDMNTLKEFGLSENTALLPHGAAAAGAPPPVRPLSPSATAAAAPIIGCHGFLFRHKGIEKLVRAVALLRKTWPSLRLRLVNARFPAGVSDDIIAECRAVAAEAGITDAIAWHTDFLPVETITTLLRGCDLIVLPYDESQDSASGAARIVLGSLAPVLATRVQIFEELGDAVAWVENNQPAVLCQAIDTLLRDRDARLAQQQAQIAWLAAHDWGRIAGRLEGMIDGLVAARQVT